MVLVAAVLVVGAVFAAVAAIATVWQDEESAE